jgi:hypothetical protein
MHVEAQDGAKLARWAAAIKDSSEKASAAWADFRNKKPEAFQTALDEVKNICVFLQMVAKTMGMDLTPFRSSVKAFEDFQVKVLSGRVDTTKYSPSVLGKVTLSLRDTRMAAKELVVDARDLRGPKESAYDYLAFGTDLGIIASSLVPLAKALRVDVQGVTRMRNAISTHFKIISDKALEAVPEGGAIEEVPAESIVFAAWAKRASIETRRNPTKASAMLDGLLKAVER